MNLVQITCTFKWQTLFPFTLTELLKIGVQLWKLRLSVIMYWHIFFNKRNSTLFLMCPCERLSKLPNDLLILMSNNISRFENLGENPDQKS